MGLAVGFDIGGTFTDFVMLATESNEWFFTKVRTTPKDRSAACIEGVQSLLGQARRTPDALTHVGPGALDFFTEEKTVYLNYLGVPRP